MAAAATRPVVDAFAGAGGWDIAADALGMRPLGIELDASACKVREAAGLWTLQADVAALDPVEVMREHFDGEALWGYIGSPPCTAFSMAGNGHGRKAMAVYEDAIESMRRGFPVNRKVLDEKCSDESAHLVLEPLRWVLALRPEWVALEQVAPVLPLWEATAAALRDVGYFAWTGVLSSECFGVAQTRKRAILLASLTAPVSAPPATHQRYIAPRRRDEATDALFDAPEPERIVVPEDRDLEPWVSMAQALRWGMTARPGMTVAPGTANGGPDVAGGSGARAIITAERERGAWIEGQRRNSGPGARREPRAIDEPSHTIRSQGSGSHPSGCEWILVANANAARRGVDEPAPTITAAHDHGERRWVPTHLRSGQSVAGEGRAERSVDEPSLTVIGRSDLSEWVAERNWGGGGPTPEQRPATTVAGDASLASPAHHNHGEQNAHALRVTVDEASALQSFPPGFPFMAAGSRTKAFMAVGNAIPVALAIPCLGAATHTDWKPVHSDYLTALYGAREGVMS